MDEDYNGVITFENDDRELLERLYQAIKIAEQKMWIYKVKVVSDSPLHTCKNNFEAQINCYDVPKLNNLEQWANFIAINTNIYIKVADHSDDLFINTDLGGKYYKEKFCLDTTKSEWLAPDEWDIEYFETEEEVMERVKEKYRGIFDVDDSVELRRLLMQGDFNISEFCSD